MMDILHPSVIAALLYFILPGSLETNSHLSPSNSSHHSDCWWDGNFIVNCSFTGISAIPEDITPTVLTADLSYNNITTLLRATGGNPEWMLKHLNLSNNLISELSFATTFRNLPSLETLNLNGNALSTLTLGPPAHTAHGDGEASRLLPALKVLAVERNSLNRIPQGLGLLQSLQTVHLSSNDILQIDVNDFQNCSQLKNIYLQDNKITKIHPEAFKDLNDLQVVDLRGNALTTLPPHILNNLNVFQLGVDSSNNPCVCNYDLNTFKYLIHFLSLISHNISATNILQKPLLPLQFKLKLENDSVSFKTTVIPTGKTSVLNCNLDNTRGNGVSWWTPIGRISRDTSLPHMTLDKMSNLVIHSADRTVAGFYMCTFNTTRNKYLIYNIQVKEKLSTSLVRKPRATNTMFRQGTTRQDLVLAICLSVFITFVFAFCLGVFARPYLGKLWRLMRRNKNSPSEHIYSNEAFSNEALGRECTASIPTNTRSNLLICDENSLKSTHIFPTETSRLHESVIYNNVHAPNTGEEYQKQCSNQIKAEQKSLFSNSKANTISNEHYINIDPNAPSSVGMYYRNSKEITPRKLTNQDISLHEDSNYANSEDLERSSFPPTPGSKIANESHPLQSETTEATVHFPKQKEVIYDNEPLSTSAVLPRTQNCNKELGVNDKKGKISDARDFILPSSSQKDINHENLSAYLASDNSLTEYYKRGGTAEQDDLADIFGDSSSDEGVPFTMSDCSSSSDFELAQPPSNKLPGCQSSLEKADANKEADGSPTTPRSPRLAAEHQHVAKDENTDDDDDSETTASYGSDTTTSQTESPYTDKHSDHGTESDSNTITFSYQKVPDMFKSSTHPESTIQNSIPHSTHKQNTSSNDTLASSEPSPTYASHTEDTPAKGADLALPQFSIQAQHFPRFNPTAQEENMAEISADSTDRSSSEEDNSEEDIALRGDMSTSEKDHFTFAPNDFVCNQVIRKMVLLSSDRAISESALPSQPQSTSEGCIMVTTEKEDSLPQEKQVKTPNTQNMEKGFNKSEHDEYSETQDSTSCNLPDETQSCNVTADPHHPSYSVKTQSGFSTEKYSQLDQSEENAYSSPLSQRSFNENIQYSLWSLPQTRENTASRKTDSSDSEDDATLTALENYPTTVVNLQNSREKLNQKNKTNLNHGQFFVKKKRAFDGFANVLQSRTNFSEV
ncbi:PREDICTED: leucine-rich repeat-containing protein 66 [Tinamus guttatus]|nr:PREDICTED: leucine-rich repeat-containing protein 66 [Tinamus guttatus]